MKMGDVTHVETVANRAILDIKNHYETILRLMCDSHEAELTNRFLRGFLVGAVSGLFVSFVTMWIALF